MVFVFYLHHHLFFRLFMGIAVLKRQWLVFTSYRHPCTGVISAGVLFALHLDRYCCAESRIFFALLQTGSPAVYWLSGGEGHRLQAQTKTGPSQSRGGVLSGPCAQHAACPLRSWPLSSWSRVPLLSPVRVFTDSHLSVYFHPTAYD